MIRFLLEGWCDNFELLSYFLMVWRTIGRITNCVLETQILLWLQVIIQFLHDRNADYQTFTLLAVFRRVCLNFWCLSWLPNCTRQLFQLHKTTRNDFVYFIKLPQMGFFFLSNWRNRTFFMIKNYIFRFFQVWLDWSSLDNLICHQISKVLLSQIYE